MRKLMVFNSISLDGYFTDAKGDIGWVHAGADDPEFAAFTASNAKGGGTLVFGRVTYEMMAAYWPTPAAAKASPEVAEQMNKLEKIVFSRTLRDARWSNTKLVGGDPAGALRKMKEERGPNMVIMGSGSIVAQVAGAGVVDVYQMIVCPILLGKGRTMFEGLGAPLALQLTESRAFRNGKLLVSYVPAK